MVGDVSLVTDPSLIGTLQGEDSVSSPSVEG